MGFLGLFFVTCIVFSLGQTQTIQQLAEVLAARAYCEVTNLASLKKLRRVRDGDFTIEDDKVKAYVFCVYRTLGLVSPDGTMDKAAGLRAITSQTDPARFSAAVDACNNQSGTTPQNKFWNELVCYNTQYPGDISAL